MNIRWILLGTGMIAVSLLRAASPPVDFLPGTVEGFLPNGLHYLVLPNSEPVHNVELRLVMRVGSVQENESQKGAAHFLEHMAFAGTRHFPGRSMVEFLEAQGMKYGRDINAVTGYDRTVFMLSAPMGREDTLLLDRTLLMLRDWLDGITFDEERTRRERGVILEELRGYDVGDDFYALKMGNSRFSQRMPLGTAEDIRSIERETLQEYYAKWYAPQLAAVILVGAVDTTQAVQLIRKHFSDVPVKEISAFRTYPLTYESGIRIQEHTDTLLSKSEMELIIPHPATVTHTLEELVRKERSGLLVRMLARRLRQQGIDCQVTDDWYLADRNHFVLSARGENRPDLRTTLLHALAELDRIRREGFQGDELRDACDAYLQRLTLPDSDRRSAEWCEDFTDYILSGDRYVHTSADLARLQQQMRQTTSGDLQTMLSGWLAGRDTTLLVACRNHLVPEAPLNAAWMEQLWQDKDTVQLAPYRYHRAADNEKILPAPACLLRPPRFSPSDIKSEKYYSGLGVTEIVLTNGLKLLLRPTPDHSGRMLVNLFSRGGVGDLPAEDYYRYEGTAGYMEMGGIAKVNADTLSEFMLQNELSMNVSISNSWHDILASAPVGEALPLFQLMYEKMHAPELCREDFEEIKKGELEDWNQETILQRQMQQAPDRQLTNRLNVLVGNVPPAARAKRRREHLEQLNLDSMAAYYRRLFTDPEGMTLVLTGDFSTETIKQIAVPVFARMRRSAESMRPTAVRCPTLVQQHREGFAGERETQTVLEYVFPGFYEPSLRSSLTLKLVRDVLQARVLDILREREHIVYSPYVSLFYNGSPEQTYYLNLSLSVDQANTARTDTLVRQIIRSLQKEPIAEQELEQLKRSFRINKMQVLTQSASTEWRNTLSNLLKNGESLEDFEHYDDILEQIGVEDIRRAFEACLDADRHILLYIGEHQFDQKNSCTKTVKNKKNHEENKEK